ncbi:replication-relaxation family protein [Kitasatospora sp. NPDC092948]|uniref:replication-relaxation family protein n=1 Tax=Kitasatospora sp. NPDC092948 TaxID=3364088 RepID=UPI003806543F
MAMPPEIDHAVVAALYQFRMATAEQLRVLHTPDAGIEQMRRRLRRLHEEGLVDSVVLPQAGKLQAWFLTERAVKIAATFPELEGVASPPLPEDKSAARLRLGHVLAVVRTHVTFVAGARAQGDECAPLDFLPEVYHRFGEAPGGALIPDGLLHYSKKKPNRVLHRAFVEVDRGTMSSEKLAAKLIAYARFHEHHPVPAHLRRTSHSQSVLPAWQQHYPAFPRLLFVLADTGERAALRRLRDMQAVAAAHPMVERMLTFQRVKAGAARLADLEQHGVNAPVWDSISDPARARCGAWEL